MKRCTALGKIFVFFAFGFMLAVWLSAADSIIGTWVRQSVDSKKPDGGMLMTVEAWGENGRKLTYTIKMPDGKEAILTVESPMDGTDVPVLVGGKPSGETMGIKRVDSHHLVTVVKMNGEQFGIRARLCRMTSTP